MEYKAHFRLVIEEPPRVSLTKASICPGYTTKMQMLVHGSYKLIGHTITWLYSTNNRTDWKMVDFNFQSFELSHENIKNIDKPTWIRVSAMTKAIYRVYQKKCKTKYGSVKETIKSITKIAIKGS